MNSYLNIYFYWVKVSQFETSIILQILGYSRTYSVIAVQRQVSETIVALPVALRVNTTRISQTLTVYELPHNYEGRLIFTKLKRHLQKKRKTTFHFLTIFHCQTKHQPDGLNIQSTFFVAVFSRHSFLCSSSKARQLSWNFQR